MGLLHFLGWLCSTYCMGNTISRWMFLYQRSRSAVQKVHFRCSCGTSQHWYMLIFALNHNEHIAWGKDNFAFHLSWAVNSLFLLFRFGIFFLWCNYEALKCNALKHFNPSSRSITSTSPHARESVQAAGKQTGSCHLLQTTCTSALKLGLHIHELTVKTLSNTHGAELQLEATTSHISAALCITDRR